MKPQTEESLMKRKQKHNRSVSVTSSENLNMREVAANWSRVDLKATGQVKRTETHQGVLKDEEGVDVSG